uniref:Uncharacterized protein n=1 Tax=Cacopsylla melanoneura TaxID=428564 RepID=A0A8D8YQT4_9HEMI
MEKVNMHHSLNQLPSHLLEFHNPSNGTFFKKTPCITNSFDVFKISNHPELRLNSFLLKISSLCSDVLSFQIKSTEKNNLFYYLWCIVIFYFTSFQLIEV